MGRHSTAITPEAPNLSLEIETLTPPSSPQSKKRKRDGGAILEIEVDINAPEPPSKKALRKSKKGEKVDRTATGEQARSKETASTGEAGKDESDKPTNRSAHGIWIGNLSWMTTKNDLRGFLDTNMSDGGTSITRIYLPPRSQASLMHSRQKIKPNNKGFAYVDFATQDALVEALGLSEKLFSGRKVLIKDAKSFEGRPAKSADGPTEMETLAGKPPSRRIFVGNLGFDINKEEIREHFSRCGEVEDVFLTTFEDSGKCKGYGWITFADLEAARAAIRGWVDMHTSSNDGVDDEMAADDATDQVKETEIQSVKYREKSGKKAKPRKWWINRFQGRSLRMEFAEGKDVRYKKRYGKTGTGVQRAVVGEEEGVKKGSYEGGRVANSFPRRNEYDDRKVDARTIKPGAALAAAPRLTGGIVESTGKRTTFDH